MGECNVEELHPLNNSDHSMLSITMYIGRVESTVYPASNSTNVKWGKLSQHEMKTRYADRLDSIAIVIKDAFEMSDGCHSAIDNCFSKLTDAMHLVANDLPRSKFKKNLKPFWDSVLSRLKKEKVECYRVWVNAGRPRDPDNSLWKNYKETKKVFSNKLKKLTRKYENDEIIQIAKSAEINRNSFWNRV